MQDEIRNLRNRAVSTIAEAGTPEELEKIRIEYLGRSGSLTNLFKKIKDVPDDQRATLGNLINETKNTLTTELEAAVKSIRHIKNEYFDITVPGLEPQVGHLHLVTQAIAEITDIFRQVGFTRSMYPEVEWDYFAFESLGFEKNHPARDEWETFLVDEKPHPIYGPMVLTPHTSSGQVREMKLVGKPPIRMINIAKCYRRQSDVSHVPMFHQFEGLVVDKDISIAHLKGTLDYFVKSYFGPNRKTRIRPYNFPFTEPSFEVDINCAICDGVGCRLCKGGWLEIGGSGMVHPNVLENGGIDSTTYSGFAFGWGVERVLMVRTGIDDIRKIYSTDLRYLTQF
jgi:phenylalanyl-tRNA synthetase alpha chain